MMPVVAVTCPFYRAHVPEQILVMVVVENPAIVLVVTSLRGRTRPDIERGAHFISPPEKNCLFQNSASWITSRVSIVHSE